MTFPANIAAILPQFLAVKSWRAWYLYAQKKEAPVGVRCFLKLGKI